MSNRKERKDAKAAKAARRNMKLMRNSVLAQPETAEQINNYQPDKATDFAELELRILAVSGFASGFTGRRLYRAR